MTNPSLRTEAHEHPFVKQAKQFVREAGTPTTLTDNAMINWAVKLQEDALAFGNRRR